MKNKGFTKKCHAELDSASHLISGLESGEIPNQVWNDNINKRRGFTLLELLVVVLIIGILASIALPQYRRAVEKSRAMELYTLFDSLYKAQTTYYLANGGWAMDYSELDIGFPYDDGGSATTNFTGGDYTWQKCGGGECVYAYKDYKGGKYALQVYFSPQGVAQYGKIVCMADDANKALGICKSLGFSTDTPFATFNIVPGRMNYYSK